MATVKARFDGRVFVPESAVDLPVGCELEIPIPVPLGSGSDCPLPKQPRSPGSAVGKLFILKEDDDHLHDFREYME